MGELNRDTIDRDDISNKNEKMECDVTIIIKKKRKK